MHASLALRMKMTIMPSAMCVCNALFLFVVKDCKDRIELHTAPSVVADASSQVDPMLPPGVRPYSRLWLAVLNRLDSIFAIPKSPYRRL
jgi:hypothetical protein